MVVVVVVIAAIMAVVVVVIMLLLLLLAIIILINNNNNNVLTRKSPLFQTRNLQQLTPRAQVLSLGMVSRPPLRPVLRRDRGGGSLLLVAGKVEVVAEEPIPIAVPAKLGTVCAVMRSSIPRLMGIVPAEPAPLCLSPASMLRVMKVVLVRVVTQLSIIPLVRWILHLMEARRRGNTASV